MIVPLIIPIDSSPATFTVSIQPGDKLEIEPGVYMVSASVPTVMAIGRDVHRIRVGDAQLVSIGEGQLATVYTHVVLTGELTFTRTAKES